MRGSMKQTINKLKKWQVGYAKQQADLQAIYGGLLAGEMKGERVLADAGKIEEAAMVVSQEGMKYIMGWFGDMVQERIEQMMPEFKMIVREAVREELSALLRGMLAGAEVNHVEPAKIEEPEQVEEESTERRKRITQDEKIRMAAFVVSCLRRRSPQTLRNLMKQMEEAGFDVEGRNVTLFMDKLMQVEPRIKKVGRGLVALDD